MTSEKADEISAIHRALTSLQKRIRTLVPATVVSYLEAGPFGPVATCQPTRMFKDGLGVPHAIQPIPNCPVLWPRAGGIAIWGSLSPGDEVMLGIADRSIDEFILRAQGAPPMPPDSLRMHDMSDAVVILGLSSASNPLPPAAGSFRVGREDGTATMRITITGPGEFEIEAASIKLGADALESVVKGDAFKTLYNAHTHTGVTTGPGSTGTPTVPMESFAGLHLSQKVKVGG